MVFAILLAASYESNAPHFIGAAMKLDESIQLNIKDLLESAMLTLNSDPNMALTRDFADVLTVRTGKLLVRPDIAFILYCAWLIYTLYLGLKVLCCGFF